MDISTAKVNIRNKIIHLNIDELLISPYNKRYFKRYQQHLDYYLDSYAYLLSNAISKLDKPVSSAVFLDYGGGCGLLSYFAIELGFKNVIYNDVYDVSIADVKVISRHLQLHIDKFIWGDIHQVTKSLNQSKIYPDLICSFDVLEHIYDINNWFLQLKEFNHPFQLFFKTSANGKNPLVNRHLKKMQRIDELHGVEKQEGWKERDLNSSFLSERKKIIRNNFEQLTDGEVSRLSVLTRGLNEEDIKKEILYYITNGTFRYKINHSTNTCDPYTGNWTEKIIDTKSLSEYLRSLGFECNVTNSLYPYSHKKFLNIIKYLLNTVIKLTGKDKLFFSPSYTLEVENKSDR
ncbi:MAG: class I SAM-dependent methyltransferase [Paludibacteraceae bacterium]